MENDEQSKYLYEQYENALGEQLKSNKSQYVLGDLNKKPAEKDMSGVLQTANSEYLLRDLQQQHEQNPNISRDAPSRPFLVGTPVPAREIRTQIESLDNAVVIPQIINGKVYFTTHGDADARTAVEGSASNTSLRESHQVAADIKNVKFSFSQLIQLLGPSTCARLEREFVKQKNLSDAELNQLKTARESVSATNTANENLRSSESSATTIRTAQSVEPNLLSVHTANSLEPNLLSVYSARSPGLATKIFAKSPGMHTANSMEPNLLSVHSAKSPGLATKIFAKSPGVHTANSLEPNMLSVHTANSVEPNLLSVYSARSPGLATKIFAVSPGIHTAQDREPNLLSVATCRSASNQSLTGSESRDVNTCFEFEGDLPTSGVRTAQGFPMSSRSNETLTAQEMRSSQDVQTAQSIRSSQDVTTAFEIMSDIRSSQDVNTALSIRSSHDVNTAMEIEARNEPVETPI